MKYRTRRPACTAAWSSEGVGLAGAGRYQRVPDSPIDDDSDHDRLITVIKTALATLPARRRGPFSRMLGLSSVSVFRMQVALSRTRARDDNQEPPCSSGAPSATVRPYVQNPAKGSHNGLAGCNIIDDNGICSDDRTKSYSNWS